MSSSDEEEGEKIHRIKSFINSPTLRHVKEVNLFLLVSVMALTVGLIHIHNTATSSIVRYKPTILYLFAKFFPYQLWDAPKINIIMSDYWEIIGTDHNID